MARQNRARTGETIDEILHSIVIRNPKYSVPQLADELGVPEWIVYEWVGLNSKRQFPLSMLLPLTRLTGDTSLIEHIAGQAGLVTFRVRKHGKNKLENAEDLLEYMRKFSTLLTGLIKAFKDKTAFDRRELLQEFDKFLSIAAGLRQDVENLSDQLDLSLGE